MRVTLYLRTKKDDKRYGNAGLFDGAHILSDAVYNLSFSHVINSSR